MLEEPRETFSASYWNLSFLVRLERVKGFHYRNLWFKNITKSKRNQVRENKEEHTNEKQKASETVQRYPISGFKQGYMNTNQKNCEKYRKEKKNKKGY